MIPVKSLDPVGNTGSNSQNVQLPFKYGYDWLTVVIKVASQTELINLLDYVADSIADTWQFKTTGITIGCDWQHWAKSANGSIASWNSVSDGFTLRLSLCASSLSATGGTRETMRLFSRLFALGARATRIDIFCDDYANWFNVMRPMIKSEFKSGNAVGFRKIKEITESDRWNEDNTLYLGTRQSESFHRIYDKQERTRWENQLGDGKANCLYALSCQVFDSMSSSDDFENLFCSLIRDSLFSSLDFVYRKGKNLDRAVRVEWWDWFLKRLNVQPMKLQSARNTTTFEKTKAWIERAVAKALAKMKAVYADYPVWLQRLVDNGRDRLTTGEKNLISSFHDDRRREGRREKVRLSESDNHEYIGDIIRDSRYAKECTMSAAFGFG